nr:phage holin family protein [Marinobacterium sedimentorum]
MILFAACAASCGRLLFYRRAGAAFKRSISALAYLLILVTGSVALCLLTGKFNATDLHPLLIAALLLLTALIYYARGNVAVLLRLREHRWN